MGLLKFLFGERKHKSEQADELARIQREMKELKKDLRAAAANQQPSESKDLGSDDEIQQALQDLRETEGLDERQEARAEEFLRARQILQESLTIAQETENSDKRSSCLDVASKNLKQLEFLSDLIDCPFSLEPQPVWKTINDLQASDIQATSNKEPIQKSVPISEEQGQGEEGWVYGEVQPWLTKAVEHKKVKEWDEAIAALDQAYLIASKYPISQYGEWGHYLRLPAYLQLAGKNDLAWKYFNDYQCGELPHRPQSNELALDIGLRTAIEDKKRLFLEREKKYRAALITRSVHQFFSSSRAFLWHMECMAAVENKIWLENEHGKAASRSMWKENLVHAEKNAFAHGMSGIKDELWKTAKKLKMSEASTERLAGEVFAMACGVSSEQQAVLRAAEATRGFAGVIDEELET